MALVAVVHEIAYFDLFSTVLEFVIKQVVSEGGWFTRGNVRLWRWNFQMRRSMAPSPLAYLEQYEWPGNVRELENAIKRALVLATTSILSPADFHFLEEGGVTEPEGIHLTDLVTETVRSALTAPEPKEIYRLLLEQVEKPLVETVLRHTEGNQIRAAALLGINRNTLRKKIADLGIDLPQRES